MAYKKIKQDKQRPLTIKQRKFTKAYIETNGNATQAALQAYTTDDPNTAGMIGSSNLRKPKIKEAIETALIELELNPKTVLKTFVDIIDLHKVSNPNASVRANENIANIMNLYPSQKSLSLDNGSIKSLSWQE